MLCSLVPFASTAAILVNSLTLVGIALDRYWAVVKFINGTWNPSAVFCTAWAVFVWGLAAGERSLIWLNTVFCLFNIVILPIHFLLHCTGHGWCETEHPT